MVVNRELFGAIVSHARGTGTKDDVDERGGPPRQRLAQIEVGDPIDLTPGLLSQIDTAFGWGRGTSEIVLSPVRPPADLRWALGADRNEFGLTGLQRADGLGVDDELKIVALPPVLTVDRWSLVLPVIGRWRGPVLIDLGSDEAERDEEIRRWLLRSSDVDRSRWRRTGMTGPDGAAPIAIDPLPEIRNSRKAEQTLERIGGFISALMDISGPRPSNRLRSLDKAMQTRSVRGMTATLLFMAAQAHGEGRDGLQVLSKLVSTTPDEDLKYNAWPRFFAATGLSSRLEHMDAGVQAVLEPLLALRDFHTELALKERQEDGQVTGGPLQVHNVGPKLEVHRPSDLDGKVVFYDSDTCPFLPVFVDLAYEPRPGSPLLVTVGADNERLNALRSLLPKSHIVAVTPDAALDVSTSPHRPELPQFARLVAPRPGLTILVPSAQDAAKGAASQRVWLSETGESVSNRHEADSREETQRFFLEWKGRFGEFDTAQLDNRDGHPNLILTDDRGRRLILWGLSLGHDGDGPAISAQILADANMGTEDAMRQITMRHQQWPVTVVRSPKQLVLQYGPVIRGTRQTPADDLRAGHGVIAGGDDATMTLLTEALPLLRRHRSVNDLMVLGATQRAPRPWAQLLGAHNLGFAGGLRDGAATATWLDTTLSDELWRRQRLLEAGQAANAAEYRAAGGLMPTLLVIIDGLDGPDNHWLTTPALRDAVTCADRFDIRVLLVGKNPEQLRKQLESDIARERSDSLPQFVFRVVLAGAAPSAVPDELDRAHIYGPKNTGDAGFLWGLGDSDPLKFEPWNPGGAHARFPGDDESAAAAELDLAPPVAEHLP